MSAYEELKKIIQNEDQNSLNDWLNKPREIISVFDDPTTMMRNVSMELGSVFGYENAIRHGYIVNSEDLFQSCSKGDADVVDLLLRYVDPNQYSEYGNPLYIAINRGYPTIVDILLEAGAKPHANDGFMAAHLGDITLVHKLYVHGLLPTAEMVEVAIRNENIPMIDAILDIHPELQFSYDDVRTREMALYFFPTPPMVANALKMLKEHDPRCLILLIANPRLAETVIDYTLEHNSDDGLRCIINYMDMVNMNPFAEKIITIAARMNSTRILRWIDQYPTFKLPNYDYPLIEAIAAGNTKVLKLFLEHGMNLNILSLKQMSPVMLAAANNDVEILQMLLLHGASTAPVLGHSPLSVAVAYNSVECIKLLESM